MITAISIESFRGVREGKVEGLAPISILVGPNNSGKSTVLEAITAVAYTTRPDEIVKLFERRGGPPLDALEQVVARGAKSANIEIQKLVDGKFQKWAGEIQVVPSVEPTHRKVAAANGLLDPILELVTKNGIICVDAEGRTSTPYEAAKFNPLFPLIFVDIESVRAVGALEDAYTAIEQAGKVDVVVRSLRRSMGDLKDLRILKSRQKFILHAFYDSGPPVPVFVAGDGFKRFLEVAAAVLGTPQGVVLLEEPETYQHPRYLQELATLLHLAARQGTQIILSTHSIELIDLLLHAPEAEGQSYPAVHRLRLYDGTLSATTIPRENAIVARDDLLEDLRA